MINKASPDYDTLATGESPIYPILKLYFITLIRLQAEKSSNVEKAAVSSFIGIRDCAFKQQQQQRPHTAQY